MENKINKENDTLRNIFNGDKVIGREIECDCGCGRWLRVFDDMEYDQVEVVMQTECSKPEEDQWKKSFIITKKNLKILMQDINNYKAEYDRGKADGVEETLDDNNILHGDDADRFIENMIKAETEPPTKREKELMEEIKREGKAGLFDVK